MLNHKTASHPGRYFATVAYFTHSCTHTHAHTYRVEEGEGVPWPFAVPVFNIWGADVDLCVSVATADGNIRALPWLSEILLSSFPSLFSPAVSGSVYSLCLCLLSICLWASLCLFLTADSRPLERLVVCVYLVILLTAMTIYKFAFLSK